MAVLTVYSDPADALVYSHDATYAIARSGSLLVAKPANGTIEAAGCDPEASEIFIYESFLGFDTSGIPDDATITAATLSVYANGTNYSTQDFTLQARPYDWGTTVTTADWVSGTAFNALTISATKATSGWTVNAYNDLTETGTNLQAAINKTGFTRFVLNSDRFAAGTAPSGTTDEFVEFYMGDDATRKPKLVVTYTFPPIVLTATYHNRADGTPAKGQVTFRLTDEIRGAVGNIIAARVRHKAHLLNGAFTISLPVNTGGVGYVVVEEIADTEKRRYTVTIPATPAAQTLAEVS